MSAIYLTLENELKSVPSILVFLEDCALDTIFQKPPEPGEVLYGRFQIRY